MKTIYVFESRNGYKEIVSIRFEARTILDAETIAKNWMKHNFIRHGWLSNESGRSIFLSW